jgi:hypothetical protein
VRGLVFPRTVLSPLSLQRELNVEMQLPKFFKLVRTVALIGACINGSLGVIGFFWGFSQLGNGFLAFLFAVAGSLMQIVYSCVGYGIVDCFLHMVEAQVDMRNAIVKNASLNHLTAAPRE